MSVIHAHPLLPPFPFPIRGPRPAVNAERMKASRHEADAAEAEEGTEGQRGHAHTAADARRVAALPRAHAPRLRRQRVASELLPSPIVCAAASLARTEMLALTRAAAIRERQSIKPKGRVRKIASKYGPPPPPRVRERAGPHACWSLQTLTRASCAHLRYACSHSRLARRCPCTRRRRTASCRTGSQLRIT